MSDTVPYTPRTRVLRGILWQLGRLRSANVSRAHALVNDYALRIERRLQLAEQRHGLSRRDLVVVVAQHPQFDRAQRIGTSTWVDVFPRSVLLAELREVAPHLVSRVEEPIEPPHAAVVACTLDGVMMALRYEAPSQPIEYPGGPQRDDDEA